MDIFFNWTMWQIECWLCFLRLLQTSCRVIFYCPDEEDVKAGYLKTVFIFYYQDYKKNLLSFILQTILTLIHAVQTIGSHIWRNVCTGAVHAETVRLQRQLQTGKQLDKGSIRNLWWSLNCLYFETFQIYVFLQFKQSTFVKKTSCGWAVLSHRCVTIMPVWYFVSMEMYKVSRLRDSIAETWYFIHFKYSTS